MRKSASKFLIMELSIIIWVIRVILLRLQVMPVSILVWVVFSLITIKSALFLWLPPVWLPLIIIIHTSSVINRLWLILKIIILVTNLLDSIGSLVVAIFYCPVSIIVPIIICVPSVLVLLPFPVILPLVLIIHFCILIML